MTIRLSEFAKMSADERNLALTQLTGCAKPPLERIYVELLLPTGLVEEIDAKLVPRYGDRDEAVRVALRFGIEAIEDIWEREARREEE